MRSVIYTIPCKILSYVECDQPQLIGNGYCNDETNNKECNYDGGDCCGSCINNDYCKSCNCIDEKFWGIKGSNALLGDGTCNKKYNSTECDYDKGDCLDVLQACAFGIFPYTVGDGYCDDEANNEACSYDGGDCCGNVKTERCTECDCYLKELCASGSPPSTVGDGICHDEHNIEECMFDGLDCCGVDIPYFYDKTSPDHNYNDDEYYYYLYFYSYKKAINEASPDTSQCTKCDCYGK